MVPSGRPSAAVAPGDLGPEQRPDGAVDVADGYGNLHRGGVVQGGLAGLDQHPVQRLVEPVVLGLHAVAGLAGRHGEARPGWGRGPGPAAFQWPTAPLTSISSGWPMTSSRDRKPRDASSSRTSSAMYSKKLTTNSGRPENRLRSSGFWVAMPTGQVSRWQTRIMMQPAHHQRGGGEAVLLGPEQGGDHHVPPRLELAVDLHHDAIAEPIPHAGSAGSRPGPAPTGRRRA